MADVKYVLNKDMYERLSLTSEYAGFAAKLADLGCAPKQGVALTSRWQKRQRRVMRLVHCPERVCAANDDRLCDLKHR